MRLPGACTLQPLLIAHAAQQRTIIELLRTLLHAKLSRSGS